jgi:phosphomannomutase
MGGFIFPEFQNAFDAIYAIGKIMGMMSQENLSLSNIGKGFHILKCYIEQFRGSWDKKGK